MPKETIACTDGIASEIRAILLRLPLFNGFPDAKIETFPFPGNPSYNRPAFYPVFERSLTCSHAIGLAAR